MNKIWIPLIILSGIVPYFCHADTVPMKEYTLLSTGMHEGEILYRIGPYDHETVSYDHHPYHVIEKTWYYYPAPGDYSRGHWITEIRFNGSGIVTHLDRYKAW